MAEYGVILGTTPGDTTANVDYTLPGFGTPEACIILSTRRDNALFQSSLANPAAWTAFFSDGTNHKLAHTMWEGGGNVSISRRILRDANYSSQGNVQRVYEVNTSASQNNFSFGEVPNSGLFIPNGVRISHYKATGADTNTRLLIFLFKDLGSDGAVAGEVQGPGDTTPVSVNIGHRPKLLFVANIANPNKDSPQNSGTLGFGCALETSPGTSVNRYAGSWHNNGQGTQTQYTESISAMGAYGFNAGDLVRAHKFDITATGFDLSQWSGNPGTNAGPIRHVYLTLDTGSDNLELVNVQTPAGTGPATIGTLDPVTAAIGCQTGVITDDTKQITAPEANGQSFSMGRAGSPGTPDVIGSIGLHGSHGESTMEVYSTTGSDIVDCRSQSGTGGFAGDQQQTANMDGGSEGQGWSGGGLQVTYSAADVRGWGWMLLIQKDTGGPPTHDLDAVLTGSVNTSGDFEPFALLSSTLQAAVNTSGEFEIAAKDLTATLSASVNTDGDFEPFALLDATLAAAVNTGGEFDVIETHDLTATLAGAVNTDGEFVAGQVITVVFQGNIATAGEVDVVPNLTTTLAGSVNTGGEFVAAPGLSVTLSGAIDTSGEFDAVPNIAVALAGSVNTSGEFEIPGTLAAVLAGSVQTGGEFLSVPNLNVELAAAVNTDGDFGVAAKDLATVFVGNIITFNEFIPVQNLSTVLDAAVDTSGSFDVRAAIQIILDGRVTTGGEFRLATAPIYRVCPVGAEQRTCSVPAETRKCDAPLS